MRFFAAAAILTAAAASAGCGNGNATCSAATPCSSGGAAYELCTESATACYYLTSDGSQFRCNTCGDCSAALSLTQSWCQRAPASTNNGTRTGETCGQAVPCTTGVGRSIKLCTSNGTTSCRYLTSDGTSFDCGSCANCQSAASLATSWCTSSTSVNPTESCTSSGASCPNGSSIQFCSSGTSCRYTVAGKSFACSSCSNCTSAAQQASQACTGTTNNGNTCAVPGATQAACRACCGQLYPAGYAVAGQLLDQCTCALCSACSANTWCGGTVSSPGASCSQCITANTSSCISQITPQCSADANCAQFGSCALACPTTP
jgi:hypothetical protein